MGRDVRDFQPDEIAAPELAVDGEVEKSEIACPPSDLKPSTDAPYLFGFERRFCTAETALVLKASFASALI